MAIPETFEDDLRRGSGRAVLTVKAGNPVEFRDILRKALTTCRPHDWQLENYRSAFLHMLINATGEPEFYVEHVCLELRTVTNDKSNGESNWFADQLARLTFHLAMDGYQVCRVALYDLFNRHAAMGEFIQGQHIVELDGIDGLRFLVAQWPTDAAWREEWHSTGYAEDCIEALRKREGKIGARRLIAANRSDPAINALFSCAVITKQSGLRSRRSHRENPKKTPLDYAQICKLINTSGIGHFRVWTRDADDETFLHLAHDLLNEQDVTIRQRRLYGFTRRAFPLEFGPLLVWADDSDFRTRMFARRALGKIRDPRIRDFVIERMPHEMMTSTLIDMLEASFEPGDESIIEQALTLASDPDDIHWLSMSVRDILEAYPAIDPVPLLTASFRIDPCGECRETLFRMLSEIDAVPGWMCEEARYDADKDLRESATKYAASKAV